MIRAIYTMTKQIELTREEVQFLFEKLQYREYSSDTLCGLFENIVNNCRDVLRIDDNYYDHSIIVIQNTLNSLIDNIERYRNVLKNNQAYTILQKIQE